MAKNLVTLVLLFASMSARVVVSASVTPDAEDNSGASSAQSINPVIEWNKILLSSYELLVPSYPLFIRLATSPSCTPLFTMPSTTLKEPSVRTLYASQMFRVLLFNQLRETKPPMTCWLRSIQLFR